MTSQRATKDDGRIVTFYSYKGGTGRSMLLANVAWVLASNGHSVLTIDWDLEAPGLHRYFHPFLKDKTLSSSEGLMDAVTEFVEEAVSLSAVESEQYSNPNMASDASEGDSFRASESSVSKEGKADDANKNWYVKYANLIRYAVPLQDTKFTKGHIDHIGPGRQGASYATKVNLFDWDGFYEKFAGAAFLDAAKKFMRDKYDYILIDSRTGVSDTSGICTMQMPDILVVCFTLNNQSIEGASAVAAAAAEYRLQSKALEPLTVIPVITRVETGESDRLELGRELARVRFRRFIAGPSEDEQINEKYREQFWGKLEVPYIPKYAFEEILATFYDRPHVLISVLAPSEQIASLIRGQATELVPPSDEDRNIVLNRFARKPYIVTVAEDFVASLSSSEQEAARKLFTRMVQVSPIQSPNATDVSCRTSVALLSKDALALLDRAISASLMRRVMSPSTSADTVEFADERLVSAWPGLKDWVNQRREFFSWRQQLDQLLTHWINSRDPDDLLTGTVLSEAVKHSAAAGEDDLSIAEREFIQASRNLDEKVRQMAVEANESPAVTRRRSSTDWQERKEFEVRARELEKVVAQRSPIRLLAYAALLVAIVGSGVFLGARRFFRAASATRPQQQDGSILPIKNNNSLSVNDRLQVEARRQQANILVTLGIYKYDEAIKVDPAQGVIAIDEKIKEALRSSNSNDVELFQSQRVDYLRNAEPLFASSPHLVKYICTHNYFVIAASEKIDHAAVGYKYWKARFPRAEIGSATSNDSAWVPVIVDSFLTCSDAQKEAAAIKKEYGAAFGSVSPNGWFGLSGCSSCSGT